jgi:hypothetical protein
MPKKNHENPQNSLCPIRRSMSTGNGLLAALKGRGTERVSLALTLLTLFETFSVLVAFLSLSRQMHGLYFDEAITAFYEILAAHPFSNHSTLYSLWQPKISHRNVVNAWIEESGSLSLACATNWTWASVNIYTQNYWGFGLRSSSGILKTREHNVTETGSVSLLMWGGRHLLCWVP